MTYSNGFLHRLNGQVTHSVFRKSSASLACWWTTMTESFAAERRRLGAVATKADISRTRIEQRRVLRLAQTRTIDAISMSSGEGGGSIRPPYITNVSFPTRYVELRHRATRPSLTVA